MKPVRGNLGYIFSFVLILHLISLMLKLSYEDFSTRKLVDDEVPLKVRIIDQKRQIVQSEDAKNKEVKDDAFLSDKDRSFNRESVARKVDTFKKVSRGGGQKVSPSPDIKLSDLAVTPKGSDPFREAAKDYSKQKKGQLSDDREAEEQISSTNDHVEKVPLGDVTNLNTAEYKYYGFYYRIRQRLEQFWGRSIQETAEELSREGRLLASDEDLITSLQIKLNSKGKIISIKIMGSSGVQELDEAAIESFNDAGPFPNPPKGMIKDGHVTLEWGFVVQTS